MTDGLLVVPQFLLLLRGRPQLHPTTSGVDLFGLSDRHIVAAVLRLPNAGGCSKYPGSAGVDPQTTFTTHLPRKVTTEEALRHHANPAHALPLQQPDLDAQLYPFWVDLHKDILSQSTRPQPSALAAAAATRFVRVGPTPGPLVGPYARVEPPRPSPPRARARAPGVSC